MTRRTRYFMAGSGAILAAGLCVGLAAYYGGGFQALSASTGPDELRYVPADAAVIAYADVGAIMNSELRHRIKLAMPMHEKGQEEFRRARSARVLHREAGASSMKTSFTRILTTPQWCFWH